MDFWLTMFPIERLSQLLQGQVIWIYIDEKGQGEIREAYSGSSYDIMKMKRAKSW